MHEPQIRLVGVRGPVVLLEVTAVDTNAGLRLLEAALAGLEARVFTTGAVGTDGVRRERIGVAHTRGLPASPVRVRQILARVIRAFNPRLTPPAWREDAPWSADLATG